MVNNLRGLLDIRRMNRVLNAWVKEFCGVTKRVNKNIDEGVLRWFVHVERMENDRAAKKTYVGE